MGKLISNLWFKKYKLRMIIGWVILSIGLFFITGNYEMIKMKFKGTDGIVEDVIIKKCFSATYLDRSILFLMCIIFIGLLFKNKKDEIREAIKLGDEGRKKYFFNKVICVYGLIIIPMAINIVIKVSCYFFYDDIFTYSQLVLSCFYFFVIGIFFSTVVFFMNILINDRFLAGIVPIFFTEGLIIFFGVSNLLISDRLAFIRDILWSIGRNILSVFSFIDLNFNSVNFSIGRQVIVISILLAITVLLIYLTYISVNIIDEKNLNRPYFFEIPRYIIYIFMSLLVSFCFVSAVGYFSIMFMPSITYVDGTFYVNIASLIFAFIIYWFLESLYRSKFMITECLKENKLEKEEDLKVFENSNRNEKEGINEISGLIYNIGEEEKVRVLEDDSECLEAFEKATLKVDYKEDYKLSDEADYKVEQELFDEKDKNLDYKSDESNVVANVNEVEKNIEEKVYEEIKTPELVEVSVNLDGIVNYEEIKEEFDISEISIKNHLEQLEVKDVNDGSDEIIKIFVEEELS